MIKNDIDFCNLGRSLNHKNVFVSIFMHTHTYTSTYINVYTYKRVCEYRPNACHVKNEDICKCGQRICNIYIICVLTMLALGYVCSSVCGSMHGVHESANLQVCMQSILAGVNN